MESSHEPLRFMAVIEADGLTIARERIAEEAKAHTGFLDLGRLGPLSCPRNCSLSSTCSD
jgi:hypothetical protein